MSSPMSGVRFETCDCRRNIVEKRVMTSNIHISFRKQSDGVFYPRVLVPYAEEAASVPDDVCQLSSF
jgi:hypothetical protein